MLEYERKETVARSRSYHELRLIPDGPSVESRRLAVVAHLSAPSRTLPVRAVTHFRCSMSSTIKRNGFDMLRHLFTIDRT